jgi:hypothetical protein
VENAITIGLLFGSKQELRSPTLVEGVKDTVTRLQVLSEDIVRVTLKTRIVV